MFTIVNTIQYKELETKVSDLYCLEKFFGLSYQSFLRRKISQLSQLSVDKFKAAFLKANINHSFFLSEKLDFPIGNSPIRENL